MPGPNGGEGAGSGKNVLLIYSKDTCNRVLHRSGRYLFTEPPGNTGVLAKLTFDPPAAPRKSCHLVLSSPFSEAVGTVTYTLVLMPFSTRRFVFLSYFWK